MKCMIIIKKELLDQIRDRRTIIASILMPAVIVPLLLFAGSQVSVENEIHAPVRIIMQCSDMNVKNMLHEASGNFQFIISDNPADAIKNGKADLEITVEKAGDVYKTMTISYDPARQFSAAAFSAVHRILTAHFSHPEEAKPSLQILPASIRSEKEVKTLLTLALILPVFLMVFAASSSMSSIIDMSSGEKERSTIETLLSCSISHTAIIMGKILAASIFGFSAAVSLMCGLFVSSFIYPSIAGGIPLLTFCGFKNIVIMLIMTSPAVFLFSSAGMVIGLYAKSIKEGTILTLPVIILSSVLSSGLIAGDPFSVPLWYLLIPVFNTSYILRLIIYGQFNAVMLMITVLADIAYASFFVYISHYLLKKENVIFRS